MNKSEKEELRSVITPALIANNQFGLTPHELNGEITSLYGKPLKLPPGVINLEDLIRKEFTDEIISVRRNDGAMVFKLIPKADTYDLLALVAKQKKTKRPSRGRARPASSVSYHPSYHYTAMHRPGVMQPPTLFGVSGMATTGKAKPTLSAAGRGILAKHVRSVSSIGSHYSSHQPLPVMPKFVPPPVSSPAPGASSSLVTSFNALFERYRSFTKHETAFDLCIKPKGGSGDTIIHSQSFPVSLADQLATCERFVMEMEKFYKKPPSSSLSMSSGRDSALSASPMFDDATISVLPENRMPPVGSILRRVSIIDLFTLQRFLIQVTTPKGKARLCPCTLFDVNVTDEAKAIAILDREIKNCFNLLDVTIKAHSGALCHVDLAPSQNSSDKHFHNQSLIKLLIDEKCVTSKAAAILADELISLPTESRLGPNVEKFSAKVVHASSATSIYVVLSEDLPRLADIENQAAVAISTGARMNFGDLKENSILLVKHQKTACRARVEKVNPVSEDIVLWLIDCGTKITAKAFDLCSISKQFQDSLLRVPPLAFELELIDFIAYNTCEAVEIVKEQIQHSTYAFRVINRQKPSALVTIESCLSDEKRGPGSLQELVVQNLIWESWFKVGKEFRANVVQTSLDTRASSLRLFVRPVSAFAEKVLEQVENLIAEIAKNNSPPSFESLNPSDELVGLYGEYFYRCRVMTKLPDAEKVHVFFYDYGDEEDVALKNLRVLPKHLNCSVLPPQATKCEFYDLPPAGSLWREDVVSILEAERLFDNPADVKVVSSTVDCHHLTVWTIDADNKRKTCLNEMLKMREDLFKRTVPRCASECATYSERETGGASTVVSLSEFITAGDEEEVVEGDDDVWTSEVSTPSEIVSAPAAVNVAEPSSFATSLAPFEKPVESPFKASVLSFIQPESFQCRFVLPQYHQFMIRLTMFYGQSKHRCPADDSLKTGDVCVAMYEESYHRAQIILAGRHSYRVCLVDMGIQQVISKEFIFKLDSQFASTPPFGFVLALENLPAHISSYYQASLNNFATNFAEEMPDIQIAASQWHVEGSIVKVVGDATVSSEGGKTYTLCSKLREFVRPGKLVAA